MVRLLPGLYTIGNPFQRHSAGAKSALNEAQLERQQYFRALSDRLGLTNRTKFVHVAGTKGKGSTCEYIAAGLRESGASVGVFTSPHLHTARERIKIGSDLIPVKDFIRLTKVAEGELKGKPWVVFFDLFLCIALNYFGERHLDYVVLETGIGGMYDSTNFVVRPCATVITNIGLDHQNILGDTIEEIAHQKAGIIKPGVPIFTTSKQVPSVMEVIRTVAEAQSAPLHVVVPENCSAARSSNYSVQRENSSLSFEVLKYLGIEITTGVKSFYWPCRMEVFSVPLSDGVSSVPFVVDGNHNGESTQLFIQGLRKAYPEHRVVIVFGSGADKCMDAMTEEVISGADVVVPVQASHFKATAINRVIDILVQKSSGGTIAQVIGLSMEQWSRSKSQTSKINGKIADNMNWLIDKLSKRDPALTGIGGDRFVIGTCGSLFVACETREYLFERIPDAFAEKDWVRNCDGI